MFLPAGLLSIFVGTLMIATPALATSSASELDPGPARRLGFEYEVQLKGASLEHLDGNADGRGTNLGVRHYQDFSYQLAPPFALEAGTQFRHYFKPASGKKTTDARVLEWRDPYVGLGASDFWKQGPQSVSGELHYYLPVTEYNEGYRASEFDEGRGVLHAEAWYARRLGAFKLKAPFEVNYRFNAKEHPRRYDYWVGAKPSLSYHLARATALKGEYYTGDLNHRTGGTWTRLNDRKLGQSVALALEWKPAEGAEISPEVKWGREQFRFNAAELSLSAAFVFL